MLTNTKHADIIIIEDKEKETLSKIKKELLNMEITDKDFMKISGTSKDFASAGYYFWSRHLSYFEQEVTGENAINAAAAVTSLIAFDKVDEHILYDCDFDLKKAIILTNIDQVKDKRTLLKIARGDITKAILKKVLSYNFVTYESFCKAVDSANREMLNHEVSNCFEA